MDPYAEREFEYWAPHTLKLMKDLKARRTVLTEGAASDAEEFRAARARAVFAGIEERAARRARERLDALADQLDAQEESQERDSSEPTSTSAES